MALTQYYVDPSIAGNSGTGTIGDPFGDLQYALNTITRDSTNGDQINIKAGTSEILSSALSLSTYGTPTAAAPLLFRGYTAAANDGGVGVISGNNSVAIFNSSTLDFVHWADLRLTNTGAAAVVRVDQSCIFSKVKVDTSTNYGLYLGALCQVIGCEFSGVTRGVYTAGANVDVLYSSFDMANGTIGIDDQFGGLTAIGNIIRCAGTADGINLGSGGSSPVILNNSIYSAAGTGQGIVSTGAALIANNIVEGFSGSGGIGIQLVSGTVRAMGHNACYNNATNYSAVGGLKVLDLGNDDTLAASPFVSPSTTDFDINGTVTGVTEDAFPSSYAIFTATSPKPDKGAVQAGNTACDYPAVGDVQTGVTYGSGTYTGTFAAPAVGDVQTGVGFGAGGTEFTGTLDLPAADDVRDGTGYGAGGTEYTGTLDLPAVGDVQTGVAFDGASKTGTFAAPAITNVRNGVGYGAGGAEYTGDIILPAAANVRNGIGYGAGGVELTGTLDVSGGGGGAASNIGWNEANFGWDESS